MEMLVVVTQPRNQHYSHNKTGVSNRFGMSPSRGFKGISCRAFDYGSGIIPSPPSVVSSFDRYFETKSPQFHSESPKLIKRSSPIAITPKLTTKGPNLNDDAEELFYPELWAGPTYSNSPPPSSLPIPKFSLRQKRSVSLELPLPPSRIEPPPVAKSAPPSPDRDSFTSATENLRRILHLDVADN